MRPRDLAKVSSEFLEVCQRSGKGDDDDLWMWTSIIAGKEAMTAHKK